MGCMQENSQRAQDQQKSDPESSALPSQSKQYFDETYDVVIVGTGCAGLTAAIVVAKKHGLSVLVAEKSRYLGGITAFSNPGLWVPCNPFQHKMGVTDSKELAWKYLKGVIGENDERSVNGFLENAPKMVQWIDEYTALHFITSPLPDYHQGKEGALATGRGLRVADFDGRKLGRSRLRDIRYVLQGSRLFDSMQMSVQDRPILLNPFASFFNLAYTVQKVLRYIADLAWYGKGSFLAGGNSIVGSLVYSLDREQKVEIWQEAPVTDIIMNGDRVAGVVVDVKSRNGPVRVRARKGIVLATGGIGRSSATERSQEYCLSPRSVSGDGIRLAVSVGADLPSQNPDYAIFAPVSILRPKQGRGPIRMFAHFGYDRGKPGSVIVNEKGHRFLNESEGYHQFVQKMHNDKLNSCYLIGDREFVRKYGMGLALPSPYPISTCLASDYLICASTIPDLAAKIGVPVNNLIEAVEQNNKNAALCKDEKFNRGNGPYDRFLGDPSHKPHPNLGTCTQAPFYALKMYPGNVSTLYGLATNENAQVLGKYGIPIKGLYAAGNDQDSLWKGTYPSGGSWLSSAMTFGFIAGNHLAMQS
ncbi:hypothetical protein LTS17_010381 [Exophiala oligosperma]